jgi:hypothetical protein
MSGVKRVFEPRGVSEKAFLSINFDDLASSLKLAAPILWEVFRSSARTRRQDKECQLKEPNKVREKYSVILYVYHI